MRREELKNELKKEPFRSFRIVMTDGKTYDITHPDLLMVGRNSVVVGLPAQPDDEYYDLSTLIDLVHVIRVEPIAKASGKNGKKKH